MKLDVSRALNNIQALYDRAELGPLNFKFRSPYNWHLLKQRVNSSALDKNVPAKDYPSLGAPTAELRKTQKQKGIHLRAQAEYYAKVAEIKEVLKLDESAPTA